MVLGQAICQAFGNGNSAAMTRIFLVNSIVLRFTKAEMLEGSGRKESIILYTLRPPKRIDAEGCLEPGSIVSN